MRERGKRLGLLHASVRWIDALNERVGTGVAWLTLIMVLLTTYDVIMR